MGTIALAPSEPNHVADLLTRTDAELVALAREGRLDAFAAIMRRYNRRVFRAARSVLTSDAAAEDAAQSTWLSAFERLDTWDPERGALGTWLGAIAVNDAIGQLRRSATRARAHGAVELEAESMGLTPRAEDSPDRHAFRAELRRHLEAAVDSLSPDLRQALVLRDIDEMSGAEAAAVLGVSELTVRLRLFRARRALRESLDAIVEDGVTELFSFDGERCDRIVARVIATLAGA